MKFYLQKLKNIYHFIIAVLACIWYRFPSRHISVIGVTGTDGKTTTTELIYHILKSTGRKASMISTVSASVGSKVYDTGFHVTTPSSFIIQKFINQSVEEGDKYFVLETTSHALDQFRVFGVRFEIGLLTNITHEHLLYHFTFKNYVYAKSKLFQWSKKAIINSDDSSYSFFKKKFKSKIHTYGIKNKADYQPKKWEIFKSLENFNKYNFLGAYAVCREIGLSDNEIIDSMITFKFPAGRIENIYDKDFTVIVDFAHTPNAIKEVLASLKIKYPNRRLVHIFGAAAFRDNAKRPIMGRESGEYADMVILTEEDFRTEDPLKIAGEIGVGLKSRNFNEVKPEDFGKKLKTYTTIIDRKKAIKLALENLKPGDLIVLTGKGHEKSLCRGKKEYPWDDKGETLALIKQLRKTL